MQVPEHEVFHAVADPTRRQLLTMLAKQELPVLALCAPFEMSRPAISKHLQVLADAGLVHMRRAGRETVYSLDAKPLRHVQEWLGGLARIPHRPGIQGPAARQQRQELVFGED